MRKGKVAIVILAAGRGSRMRRPDRSKLLALFDGRPLVRRVAGEALGSAASSVAVVTGFQREAVEAALAGLDLSLIHNPGHAEGMGGSLAAGFGAPGVEAADGALVMLADMPDVRAAHLDALIAAFGASGGKAVVRAVSGGAPGHPVILPRALYGEVRALRGAGGARRVVAACGLPVMPVEIGPAALRDIDAMRDLAEAGGMFPAP